MKRKKYSELISISSYAERFKYLKLDGRIGEDTFGADRYLNQMFYKSMDWRRFRNEIIVRDGGCDLAHPDYELFDTIIIHHLNPITKDDILDRSDLLLDPENVVCVSSLTHKAIHYGDESLLLVEPVIRRPNDTCLWR